MCSPSLAARFAAKEAATKALGTGLALGVTWRDIEVVRDILRLTGYIRGGVSPLGGKKAYAVYVDRSALEQPLVSVSAGISRAGSISSA